MDLGYDREETGYEEGYQKSCHQETIRHPAMSNASNSQRGGYYCDQLPQPLAGNSRSSIFPQPMEQRLKLFSVTNPSPEEKKKETTLTLQAPLYAQNLPSDLKTLTLKPDAKTLQIDGSTRPYQAPPPAHAQEETQSLWGPRLKAELINKGLKNPEEVDAYMARFNKYKSNPKAQDNTIKAELNRVKDMPADEVLKTFRDHQAKNSPTFHLLKDEGPQHKPTPHPLAENAKTKPAPTPTSSPIPSLKEVNGMVNALPPDMRAKAVEHSRDQLFYTLTGKQFDSDSVKLPKDIKVLEPPLTRGEALAYMQSQTLTDGEGNPLKETQADAFMGSANAVQDGALDRKTIVGWERQQIVNILHGSPYKLEGPKIASFLNSKGWLQDGPNLELMESFRKKAANQKDVKTITQEVEAANGKGGYSTMIEEDRAEQILEGLNPKQGKGNAAAKEARAGRQTSKEESAAGRDTSLKAAKIREDGENKRARESRKFQREETEIRNTHEANQQKERLNHEAKERAEDRKNQMMMTLIQFLGQMISSALQAMSQTIGASIQGQSQLAGQVIAGMKQR